MYYSPILFQEIADVNITRYHDCIIDMNKLNSKNRIIIFCIHDFLYLNTLTRFLDEVSKPFVLISAMEDMQMPLGIDEEFMIKIKSNKFFKHWFCINKTTPNDNLFTSIPYGLDYWTLIQKDHFGEKTQTIDTQNSTLESIANITQHFSKRIPKIYGNFHFCFTDKNNGGWRKKLLKIIPKTLIYYEPIIVSRTESYKNMSEFSFVVSPFGNGFDCIRTFEALCLGCIVIMKKSCLDIIYEDLPVLLVDEWMDVTEKLLNDTLLLYSNKTFNYEKLKMDYWKNIVLSKF